MFTNEDGSDGHTRTHTQADRSLSCVCWCNSFIGNPLVEISHFISGSSIKPNDLLWWTCSKKRRIAHYIQLMTRQNQWPWHCVCVCVPISKSWTTACCTKHHNKLLTILISPPINPPDSKSLMWRQNGLREPRCGTSSLGGAASRAIIVHWFICGQIGAMTTTDAINQHQ